MQWRIVPPWRHRKAMKENVKKERARTEDVRENVIKPLQEKRHRLEHNHLAQYAAEGLGIVRRTEG